MFLVLVDLAVLVFNEWQPGFQLRYCFGLVVWFGGEASQGEEEGQGEGPSKVGSRKGKRQRGLVHARLF